MVTRVVAGRTYDFSHAMGRGAVAGMGFNYGNAMFIDSEGMVYVVSRGAEFVTGVPWNRTSRGARVGKFDVGLKSGDEEYHGDFGRTGSGYGEFYWPTGVALDSKGTIYVTDEWLNKVSVWNSNWELVTEWGVVGSGEGEFDGPSGIICDGDDNILLVDSRNHRVQKYAGDGRYLSSFGFPGRGDGEFNTPWGITLDEDGYIYVADSNNDRVQKFSSGGVYVAQFGSPGKGRGELSRPSDVAVDPDGDVYVCDWGNDRVQAFDATGRFFTSFEGDARELTPWAAQVVEVNPEAVKKRREVKDITVEWKLQMPRAVDFDAANNRLIIMDTQRNRIQIYNKLKDYTSPARNL